MPNKRKNKIEIQLSIIIPAYNEEKRIKNTIIKIRNYMKHLKARYEILVIDDGSSDNTKQVVNDLKKNNVFVYSNIKRIKLIRKLLTSFF